MTFIQLFCLNPGSSIKSLICMFSSTKKRQRDKAVFLEKVFLLMGCSKNYIMYWGVFTVYIVPWHKRKVCTNFTKFSTLFWLFYILGFSSTEFSLVKSASNSSLCTFSFSRRSFAQLWSTSSCSIMISFARSWHSVIIR